MADSHEAQLPNGDEFRILIFPKEHNSTDHTHEISPIHLTDRKMRLFFKPLFLRGGVAIFDRSPAGDYSIVF